MRGHDQDCWPDRLSPRIHTQDRQRGARWNGARLIVNDAGWRAASIVGRRGTVHEHPLLLVNSLPLRWALIAIDQQRAASAALFRDGTSRGWPWETSKVRDQFHQKRQGVELVVATLITLAPGTHAAAQDILHRTQSRRRWSWAGDRRLFQLERDAFQR